MLKSGTSKVGRFAGLATAAALWLGAQTSAHATLIFDLGTIISSSGSPGGAAPWLVATVTQDGANSVTIKMEAVNLITGPYIEAVKDWAFNVNPTININQLTAVEVARTGSFNPNQIIALSSANGFGGFSFDFGFAFATAGGSVATRFTDGDSVTMKLTRAAGLLESDFDFSAIHAGREFYTGAHLISLANGKSAFIGSGAPDIVKPPPVPEPSTVIAGALLLLPFAASTLRLLRQRRTMAIRQNWQADI